MQKRVTFTRVVVDASFAFLTSYSSRKARRAGTARCSENLISRDLIGSSKNSNKFYVCPK